MKTTIAHLLAVLLFAAASFTAHSATVENVRAMQRPESTLVDVYYDLVAPEGGNYIVSLRISSDQSSPPTTTLVGDVGSGVKPGRNNHIVWDAGKDWPDNVDSNMVAVVATARRVTHPSEEMVWVPAGINEGVDPYSGAYALTNSTGFWMDRTEITFEKWMEVYRWAIANGYSFRGKEGPFAYEYAPYYSTYWYAYFASAINTIVYRFCWAGNDFSGWPVDSYPSGLGNSHFEIRTTCDGEEVRHPKKVTMRNLPVFGITLQDAYAWCNARSEMEGREPCYLSINYDGTNVTYVVYGSGKILTKNLPAERRAGSFLRKNGGYSIPTLEDWMYAARGGKRNLCFPNGNSLDQTKANYSFPRTHYLSDGEIVEESGLVSWRESQFGQFIAAEQNPKAVNAYWTSDPWYVSSEQRFHPWRCERASSSLRAEPSKILCYGFPKEEPTSWILASDYSGFPDPPTNCVTKSLSALSIDEHYDLWCHAATQRGYNNVGYRQCEFMDYQSKKQKFNLSVLPVASFEANGYGLYDMVGNVSEITDNRGEEGGWWWWRFEDMNIYDYGTNKGGGCGNTWPHGTFIGYSEEEEGLAIDWQYSDGLNYWQVVPGIRCVLKGE